MADGPITWEDEKGVRYIRASALASCPNAFIFADQQQESKYPPQVLSAFQYGIDNEQKVIDMLTTRGWDITDQQMDIRYNVTDNLAIIGHPDGLTASFKAAQRPLTLIEIKCLSHSNTEKFLSNNRWSIFPYYAYQISAYYWGLIQMGIPVKGILFGIWDKDENQLHEVTLDIPPIDTDHLNARATEIGEILFNHGMTDTWATCPSPKPLCPYTHLHDQFVEKEEVLNDPALSALVSALSTTKTKISNLEVIEKTLRSKVISHLSSHSIDTTRIQTGNVVSRVSYKLVSSNRFNVKRASAILDKETYDKCVEESTISRLTITEEK